MKAELVPENGDPPIPITRDLMVVGRRQSCDIVINHSSLSRRHCVLVKTDGLLVIRDLISTNGTKVKGQKIRWAALLPDDRITLGKYKLRVYLGPEDAPGPSELDRSRARWTGLGPRDAAAGRGSPEARPVSSPAPQVPGFAGGPPREISSHRGFPEPSPLEMIAPSSAHDLPAHPGALRDDPEPLIPIALDEDDDEIIDLE